MVHLRFSAPWKRRFRTWKPSFEVKLLGWKFRCRYHVYHIYLSYLSICSIYLKKRLANWSVNTLLLRHPYLWMRSTPTDPEPKIWASKVPKGISSTLELRTFKTFAVLEATCKAPRYLENMAKNQGFCSCGSSCGSCCCGYPDHLLLLPETSLGETSSWAVPLDSWIPSRKTSSILMQSENPY